MHLANDFVRQVGRNLAEISPHHLSRYFFAASLLNYERIVVDVGCGCGYGSWILWSATSKAVGLDISTDAIKWANEYYAGPTYMLGNAEELKMKGDAAVVFEIIEHSHKPLEILKNLDVKQLFASVPNQMNYPFNPEHFKEDTYPHLRHYTPSEFDELLESAGFKVEARFCQKSKVKNSICPGTDGKFLLYIASR